MSIAKQNFRQLGGRLEEDRELRQKERESERYCHLFLLLIIVHFSLEEKNWVLK